MPLTVQVTRELNLDHRAYYLATSASGHIAACSRTGEVSVVGPERCSVNSFVVDSSVKSISLSPSGMQLGIAFDGGLEILDQAGDRLDTIDGPFEDAFFDGTDRLWAVLRADEPDAFCVSLYDEGRPTEHTVTVEDPFGDSAVSLPKHPTTSRIPLWVAAGQDGQAVYWLDLDAQGLNAERMDDLEECGPPVVSSWSDEFLLFADGDRLRRYSLFDCELLDQGGLDPPGGAGQGLGLSIVYVAHNQALVSFEDGFVYLVDLDSMKILHEVVVAGHEPRPTRELYPGLDDDDHCSDVSELLLVDGNIVSLHTKLPDPEMQQHGVLAWWSYGHGQ